jgi:hypothetical protein
MEKDKVTIIDNFVEVNLFKEIKNLMTSENFNWFYNDAVNYVDDGFFQFNHIFYDLNSPRSEFFNLLVPVIDNLHEKVDLYSIIRIKANLTTKESSTIEYGYHIDLPDLKECHSTKTSILYINTNDGYTKFEDGTISKSVENRMIIFDSKLKHTGTSCTDKKTRILINFNFF